MYIPRELFGVETWFIGAGTLAIYLALGCWLICKWARHDDPPSRPWKWGDPVRRAKPPLIDRIIMHIGPAGLVSIVIVFVLRGMGLA